MGSSEVSMKEGATVELKKLGCAGWVYVKKLGRFLEVEKYYLLLLLLLNLFNPFTLLDLFIFHLLYENENMRNLMSFSLITHFVEVKCYNISLRAQIRRVYVL